MSAKINFINSGVVDIGAS